jgi:hypothetical protein
MELHLSNRCTTGHLLSDYGDALEQQVYDRLLLSDYGAALE